MEQNYQEGIAVLVQEAIPKKLADELSRQSLRKQELLNFLRDLARTFPLRGDDGLKARTDLMEYRYDVDTGIDFSPSTDRSLEGRNRL